MKRINGYSDYVVSKTGVVYSLKYGKHRRLKLEDNRGYKRCTLSKADKQERFLVHRLVAMHYIPNTLNKPYINHIDGNPSNNNVCNLEWCTQSENMLHSYRVLGAKPNSPWLGKKGYDNSSSIEVIKMDKDGNEIKRYGSQQEAADDIGGWQSAISRADRTNGTYYGFRWKCIH